MATAISDAPALERSGPTAWTLPWVAVLVFLGVCGGLALSDAIGRISAIWVANAILAYFLLKHRDRWLEILTVGGVSNICADLLMRDDPLMAVTLTLCNVAGILTLTVPFRVFALENDFARPKPLCVFYGLALGPAPMAAGLGAALFFHFAKGRGFLPTVLDWYATDALGYSIVVPMLMTVHADALRRMFARDQIANTLLLLGAVAGTLVLTFFARDYPVAFLIYPVAIMITFQRGFAGGSLAVLMAGGYLMAIALGGEASGVLRSYPMRERIILVQMFIAVMGFSVILVGAALAERRRLEQGLAEAIVRVEGLREEAVVARDAAERANRMKSMFLATMSHELRTPLNAIIGFSELMHGELYGSLGHARYREYSGLIEGAGRHLLNLINDVLDMSKIEAGKFELYRQSFDLCGVIRDCVDLMADRAEHAGVDLARIIPDTPLRIDADPRAMKQILLNLLSNAIKFTPQGGRIAVRAGISHSQLVLSVEDSGIGIPADQIGRLGNPFVQVRSNAGASHEGTGLGLALVRALAEIHGGSIKIDSILGKGTTVTVAIPAIQQEAALPLVAQLA